MVRLGVLNPFVTVNPGIPPNVTGESNSATEVAEPRHRIRRFTKAPTRIELVYEALQASA